VKAGERGECRSCGAKVIFLEHERTGKLAPIDAALTDAGNIMRVDDTEYAIIPPPELARLHKQGHSFRTNHYATCPHAQGWRKAS